MKKILFRTLKLVIVAYVVICGLMYFFQEKLIFFPEKLDKNFKFAFEQEFEELSIKMSDGKFVHGLLFRTDSSKGLIFYLHGNAGSTNSWGHVAKRYTDLNYDLFLLDYRGYGKSESSVSSQSQLFQDIQNVYNEMKKRYREDHIVVLGYSIGTGPAANLACTNNPRLLILQAPYYSLKDLMRHTYPIIPTFLLKYQFETNKYLKNCTVPVVVFHGNRDEVVYYNSSVKLKESMKKEDTLITLIGQGHNGITDNPQYISAIGKILH
jgi:pimeloyl-ACP methyl ester carboxylesterase